MNREEKVCILILEPAAALTETQAQLERAIVEREQAEVEQERLLAIEWAQTRRWLALLWLSAEFAATIDETEECWCVARGLRETGTPNYI